MVDRGQTRKQVEIEIPIDDDLSERVRRYAEAQGTTVEQLDP
jgi:hypothetical protein